jgi:hypothetical protein
MRTTKHEFVKGCEDTANMLKALAAFAHDLPEGDVGQVVKLLRTARPALLEIENRLREKLENEQRRQVAAGSAGKPAKGKAKGKK